MQLFGKFCFLIATASHAPIMHNPIAGLSHPICRACVSYVKTAHTRRGNILLDALMILIMTHSHALATCFMQTLELTCSASNPKTLQRLLHARQHAMHLASLSLSYYLTLLHIDSLTLLLSGSLTQNNPPCTRKLHENS